MSLLQIPINPKGELFLDISTFSSVTELSSRGDYALLEKLPNEFKEMGKKLLGKVNCNTNKDMICIMRDGAKKKSNIINEISLLFNLIKEKLDKAVSSNEDLFIEIQGDMTNFNQPTMETWKEINIIKYNVIKYFAERLIEQGWIPSVKLSKYTISDGHYTGGDTVIITCSFNARE
jgi:hypothetical protein